MANLTGKQSDLIKMENGKKDLPPGISKYKYGYRLHRTINGKKYNFSSFQSLEHAIRVNNAIEKLVADYRNVLENPEKVHAEQLATIVAENSATDVIELTREIEILKDTIADQNDLIVRQSNLTRERVLDLSVERKGFLARLFGS